MGGIGVAASRPSGATIRACVKKKGSGKGTLRVARKCRRTESRLSFNKRGPLGPAGAQGAAGTDAQFQGAAAGGALSGTYPSPSLAAPEPVHLVGAPGEPPFETGASNTPGPVHPAGFYKDGLGRVHLEGTVNQAVGDDIFRLPAGYRATTDQVCFSAPAFTAAVNFVTNRVCIVAGDEVRNSSGTGVRDINLDGMSFRAAG